MTSILWKSWEYASVVCSMYTSAGLTNKGDFPVVMFSNVAVRVPRLNVSLQVHRNCQGQCKIFVPELLSNAPIQNGRFENPTSCTNTSGPRSLW